MARVLPELVCKLCYSHGAWIVGGACVSDEPRDWDVCVPLTRWKEACMLLPRDARVNAFGGLKAVSEGQTIDVWPAELGDLMTNEQVQELWHPQSGARFSRSKSKKPNSKQNVNRQKEKK